MQNGFTGLLAGPAALPTLSEHDEKVSEQLQLSDLGVQFTVGCLCHCSLLDCTVSSYHSVPSSPRASAESYTSGASTSLHAESWRVALCDVHAVAKVWPTFTVEALPTDKSCSRTSHATLKTRRFTEPALAYEHGVSCACESKAT